MHSVARDNMLFMQSALNSLSPWEGAGAVIIPVSRVMKLKCGEVK